MAMIDRSPLSSSHAGADYTQVAFETMRNWRQQRLDHAAAGKEDFPRINEEVVAGFVANLAHSRSSSTTH